MKKGTDYAFLSNSRTALLENDGNIIWFPCPRFDSKSIFSNILDEEVGGYFSIRPEGKYSTSVSYIGNSLVVRNAFSARTGTLEVTDFLAFGLPSVIRIFDSDVPFVARIKPAFDYGRVCPEVERMEDGIRFRNPESAESFDVVIKGNFRNCGDGVLKFNPGKGHMLTLYAKDFRYGLFSLNGYVYPDPEEALRRTIRYWETQINSAKKTRLFVDEYKRSLSVMLGLMYNSSGAIIAAATTSLPTIIGNRNNWDYKYVWIRDASYAAEAFAKAGLLYKSQRVLNFMISTIDLSSKSFDHPLFEVDGTAPLAEDEAGWLSGHRGSKPVRIGNAAYTQVQMDTEGEFMDALYTYFMLSGDRGFIKENMWAIDAILSWCKRSWTNKSISLWEERDEPQHFVHTKLMNWVALDRASKLKLAMGNNEASIDLRKRSDEIKEDIMLNGFSERLNSFVKYYGSENVDASLLLMPLYNFIEVKDRMFAGTLERILERLSLPSGLMQRTENDYESDSSHPFTLINAWLARVYIRMGRKAKAVEAMKNMISYSTRLRLFGERVNPKTHETLGNFPQLFPHAGLVAAISEYNDIKLTRL